MIGDISIVTFKCHSYCHLLKIGFFIKNNYLTYILLVFPSISLQGSALAALRLADPNPSYQSYELALERA